ncbi:proline dehydrogenase family protein [Thermomonospora curvata]|uniref:proline dehydrogenase n=1 Tax=Thermomonospora curvata (strain ATCC 19995 / DSM 43183 / JCM 3096 / KCTC 9072 / NBRC 15933 / NCIMB 10081 / Henssen B9) TaxID=471852 RepID=D1A4B3_THECD|nr:proline dehydrogenase family protein [Thermomonospora curvata]ACY99987.1 Proline dehydrogenase [Thermomonospora curvata DSM 43183]
MLRRVLLAASRSGGVRKAMETAPFSRGVVHRFVAGRTAEEALTVVRRLTGGGLLVTVDHLGEDTTDARRAETVVENYLELLDLISTAGLGARAEVSVKLSAVGQALDEELALENARRICAAAKAAGTAVTLDMEDHTTVASTLRILRELREDHPETGAVVQAYLRDAERHCAELAHEGSRVRLCKGAYAAPADVAFTSRHEIDKSYVRCLKVLMAGRGYPMVATHDPRLIEIAGALAVFHDRAPDSFEYQMLYGIRPAEQRRLAAMGSRVRVYVPYGGEWYGYAMRRMAERPANLALILRSVVSGS